jgi:MFS family permease
MGLFIGLTYGISFPALIPIVASRTGLEERGVAFGVFTTSVDIGSAFGSILLGILIQQLGFSPVFTLAAVFLLALGMTYQNFLQEKLSLKSEPG